MAEDIRVEMRVLGIEEPVPGSLGLEGGEDPYRILSELEEVPFTAIITTVDEGAMTLNSAEDDKLRDGILKVAHLNQRLKLRKIVGEERKVELRFGPVEPELARLEIRY